jgi:histidinol dehydrogenase
VEICRVIELISSGDKGRLALTLERIRSRNVAFDAELLSEVSAILQDVRTRGDLALIDYAARFDGCVLQAAEFRVDEEDLRRTAARIESKVLEAIREAIRRVRTFHELEPQRSWLMETEPGVIGCMSREELPAIRQAS